MNLSDRGRLNAKWQPRQIRKKRGFLVQDRVGRRRSAELPSCTAYVSRCIFAMSEKMLRLQLLQKALKFPDSPSEFEGENAKLNYLAFIRSFRCLRYASCPPSCSFHSFVSLFKETFATAHLQSTLLMLLGCNGDAARSCSVLSSVFLFNMLVYASDVGESADCSTKVFPDISLNVSQHFLFFYNCVHSFSFKNI